MKEASGETNMTLVIVIAVASLAAFFYFVIWPAVSDNFNHNPKCSEATCKCDNENECLKNGADCWMPGKKSGTHFKCPWKG